MLKKTRDYYNYVNTQDKFLERIHVARFSLSQKLEKMSPQKQLEYFTKARQRRKKQGSS